MSSKVNPEEFVGTSGAFGSSWANRDALVREANNRWAPAAVINALMAVPNRYYRSVEDLHDHLDS